MKPVTYGVSFTRCQASSLMIISSKTYPGKVVFANPTADIQRNVFATQLALSNEQLPAKMWLTVFEDRSSPRPGTDEVYFSTAAQQTPVEPPPVTVTREERIGIPVELIVLIAGPGLFASIIWRRSRARRSPTRPSP